MEMNPSVKKALSITKTVLVWLIVAFAVFMMIFTIISVATFDKKDRGIFGTKIFIVKTDSMSATDFSAGDLIFCKNVDPATLQEGDIITFQSLNSDSYGEIITHKIRRLTTDENGSPAFITYGTTTDTDDIAPVTYSFVLGKYSGKLKGVGKFFTFLKTTPGYIVCILIPFLTLILVQGINSIRLFRSYKKEQQAELEAEKQEIEAERLESKRMMEELIALRAQLNGNMPQTAEESSASAVVPDGKQE